MKTLIVFINYKNFNYVILDGDFSHLNGLYAGTFGMTYTNEIIEKINEFDDLLWYPSGSLKYELSLDEKLLTDHKYDKIAIINYCR